jgi:hypothetical protein
MVKRIVLDYESVLVVRGCLIRHVMPIASAVDVQNKAVSSIWTEAPSAQMLNDGSCCVVYRRCNSDSFLAFWQMRIDLM